MPFTALPNAGAPLRASVLRSLITEVRPITAIKTVATDYTSNATPAADAELVIALAANTTYDFIFKGYCTSAANASGDITYQLSFPTGASVDAHQVGAHNSLASGSQAADTEVQALLSDTTSPIGNFPFGASTVTTGHEIHGRIAVGSTAGNLQILCSQLASNANKTTLLAESCLTAWMVA